MPEDTLAARIESAFDSSSESGESSGASQAEATQGFIGIEDGSSDQGTQGNDTSAQQGAWAFAENMQPDTVVAMIDGKPVTAAEVRDGYMRTQDYTAKTTDIAKQRQELQEAQEWKQTYGDYIQRLNSPDPTVREAVIKQIAQETGVNLNPRPRDDSGRFVAQQQEGLIDLSQYEEGDAAWELASQLNAKTEKINALEGKIDQLTNAFQQFTTNVTTQVETQQRQAEASAIAEKWQASGLQVDMEGAMALVGKPMTVEQAMRLHHWDPVLRHNYNLAKSPTGQAKPDEPAGGSLGKGSLHGKSLTQAFAERVT